MLPGREARSSEAASSSKGRTWTGLRSMDAVVARLREVDARMTAEGRPADEPLIAWGFDPIYFGGERMTVVHLDRASATRPIVVGHANGHLMNVNTPTDLSRASRQWARARPRSRR